MTGPELMPCPFCGGMARLVTHRTGEDSVGAYVYCVACDAHATHFDDAYAPRAEAIAAWNTRATPLAAALAVPEVRALEKEVLRLKASLWAIGHAAGIETKEDLMQAALAALRGVEGQP